MAKIGSVEFTIGEKYPRKYPLYYTQNKKFEVRGIDEEFFKLTGISSSGYQTEADLNNTIHKVIPKYHELRKKQRLVIGYRCRASTPLRMNQVGSGSYRGNLEGVSNKILSFKDFNTPYCAIGIDYVIYMEIFNGKKNNYYSVNDDLKVDSVHPVSWQKIDGMTFIGYTEDNYKFFEGVKSSMQSMVQKLSLFFSLNSEEAQKLIMSNNNLLN
jgi:hypothetical protein